MRRNRRKGSSFSHHFKERDSCLQNLHPFRGVLRCHAPTSVHNMEFVDAVFQDNGLMSGEKKFDVAKFRHGRLHAIDIPIMRNVIAVEKGDILCLPFNDKYDF